MRLSMFNRKTEAPRPIKRITHTPIEFEKPGLPGNAFKELLADPITACMDYRQDCIKAVGLHAMLEEQGKTHLFREIVSSMRKECKRGDLLANLYQQDLLDHPEWVADGYPTRDQAQFQKDDFFCKACILHRYRPAERRLFRTIPNPENIMIIDEAALPVADPATWNAPRPIFGRSRIIRGRRRVDKNVSEKAAEEPAPALSAPSKAPEVNAATATVFNEDLVRPTPDSEDIPEAVAAEAGPVEEPAPQPAEDGSSTEPPSNADYQKARTLLDAAKILLDTPAPAEGAPAEKLPAEEPLAQEVKAEQQAEQQVKITKKPRAKQTKAKAQTKKANTRKPEDKEEPKSPAKKTRVTKKASGKKERPKKAKKTEE